MDGEFEVQGYTSLMRKMGLLMAFTGLVVVVMYAIFS
jgi:hypothetical protein